MKPEHQQRRKIIREWMSLSKEKRQTQDQADAFGDKSYRANPVRSRSAYEDNEVAATSHGKGLKT
jgi:hypothetical protein